MGKQRQSHVQTAVLHIPFLSVSLISPPYKSNAVMEIHCAVEGQGRSGDLKWRKCVFVCVCVCLGGGNAHKCKIGFVLKQTKTTFR